MNKILNILNTFSIKLNVTPEQIQQKLALAPVYTLLLFFGLFFLIPLIKNGFNSSPFKELLDIFIAYTIGILLVYFVIIYIFIYASQLLLIKYYRLNLWFILGSAIILTLFFSSIVFLVTILDLGIRGFNLGIVIFIGFFALSFALMYWFLLFKQHQKNIFDHTQ